MGRGAIGWFCVLVGLLAGCTDSADESGAWPRAIEPISARYRGAGPLRAVVTVGMVADLVREIGGDRVDVQCLMGSGIDPHLYKATRDDVLALLQADIVFQNGLLLEGKMAHVLSRAGGSRPVISVAEEIFNDSDRPLSDESHSDPHVWMDVNLWVKVAQRIGARLAEFDPEFSEAYRQRCAQIVARMKALHEYGRHVIGTIPSRNRVLVTSHDAFGYFSRAYGIEVHGVQGMSTESEAGLRRVNALVDLLYQRRLPAVFLESSVPERGIAALVDGVRAKGHSLRIAGPLYSDALGPAGTYEGTYLGMLDHNFTLVARELGGVVPRGGWQGKLAEERFHE